MRAQQIILPDHPSGTGGLLLPGSVRPQAKCFVCGGRFWTEQHLRRHLGACVRKHRDDIEEDVDDMLNDPAVKSVDPERRLWLDRQRQLEEEGRR